MDPSVREDDVWVECEGGGGGGGGGGGEYEYPSWAKRQH